MPLLFTYFVFRVVVFEKKQEKTGGEKGVLLSSSLIVLYKVEVAAACSMGCGGTTLSILLFLVKLNLNAEEDEEERKRGRQSM